MNLSQFKLILLPAVLVMALMFQSKFSPAQGKATDTVSTSGMTFTAIPTAADSIATLKAKHQLTYAKVAGLKKSPAPEHKTLWQIFIAGFLGGLAALAAWKRVYRTVETLRGTK